MSKPSPEYHGPSSSMFVVGMIVGLAIGGVVGVGLDNAGFGMAIGMAVGAGIFSFVSVMWRR